MSEIAELQKRRNEEEKAGRPTALATLVRTRGSSYRRAGARALALQSGQLIGGISGGCLENDVALRARTVLETGKAMLVPYDTGADDDRLFGLNIGCGGLLDVLVEPAGKEVAELLEELEGLARRRQKAVLATVLAPPEHLGQRLLLTAAGPQGKSTIQNEKLRQATEAASRAALEKTTSSPWVNLQDPEAELFLERLTPPQALCLFGSGFDVEPLVSFGRALGFEVVVVDLRGAEQSLERFPAASRKVAARGVAEALVQLAGLLDENAAALVMNHHYDHDRELVAALLGTKVGYLGLLGPKSRGRRLLGELKAENPALDTTRVFSPVGLDLGADTPEKVALSILAEILAVLAGRQGGFLKDRESPIHGAY